MARNPPIDEKHVKKEATQAFLAEALIPSHAPRAEVSGLLDGMAHLSAGLDVQAREWFRKVDMMERHEGDIVLTGVCEELRQTCKALQRQIGELDASLSAVCKTEQQFHRIVARIKERAVELGYVC